MTFTANKSLEVTTKDVFWVEKQTFSCPINYPDIFISVLIQNSFPNCPHFLYIYSQQSLTKLYNFSSSMQTLYSLLRSPFFHFWCIRLRVLKRKHARRKVLYREVAPKSFEVWPPKISSTEASFSRLLTILNPSQTAIKVTEGLKLGTLPQQILCAKVCW